MTDGGESLSKIRFTNVEAAIGSQTCTSRTNKSKMRKNTRLVRALPLGLCTRSNTRVREAASPDPAKSHRSRGKRNALSRVATDNDDLMILPLFVGRKLKEEERETWTRMSDFERHVANLRFFP